MKRTLAHNNQLHALLGSLRISKDQKMELVNAFSNNRTQSSSELNDDECIKLINHLNGMKLHMNTPQVRVNSYADDPADKLRKKCLSVVHDLGWETVSGKIDWERLNFWLEKFGYLHKKLNDYTYEELPRLITQLENVLKSNYERN